MNLTGEKIVMKNDSKKPKSKVIIKQFGSWKAYYIMYPNTDSLCNISIYKKALGYIVNHGGLSEYRLYSKDAIKYEKQADVILGYGNCHSRHNNREKFSFTLDLSKMPGLTIADFSLLRIISDIIVNGDYKIATSDSHRIRLMEFNDNYTYNISDIMLGFKYVHRNMLITGNLNLLHLNILDSVYDDLDENVIIKSVNKVKARLNEKSRRILELVKKYLPPCNIHVLKIIRDYVISSEY